MIIDGSKIAGLSNESLKTKVKEISEKKGRPPRLGIIMVGDNSSSKIYVDKKLKKCKEIGALISLKYIDEFLKDSIIESISKYSTNPDIDGMILQLPLPGKVDPTKFLNRINPEKDIDCLTSENIGLLNQGTPRFIPCTPKGIIRLLDEYEIPIEGKIVTIINASNIVGKPLSNLFIQRGGTPTICHLETPKDRIMDFCKSSDIVVSATGCSGLISADMIKEGATVIDVGISRDDENKIKGDVDFESVSKVAGAITPVPGGVGPMTIAMLLENLVIAAS